jgi:hypothetical protein
MYTVEEEEAERWSSDHRMLKISGVGDCRILYIEHTAYCSIHIQPAVDFVQLT